MSDLDPLSPARRNARMRMLRRRRVTTLVGLAVLAVLIVALVWGCTPVWQGEERNIPPASTSHAPPSHISEETAGQDFDVDSPESITVVVNKQRPITPLDWVPTDLVLPEGIANNWSDELRAPAAAALQAMHTAAAAEGVNFIITSGYRDSTRQAALFDRYAESDGIEAAESYSARPGHSEHQTGLAVDLTDGGECALEECFGETETGLWLRDNSSRFGFILRYEQGQEGIVGYGYEPWHFRYVGLDVAAAMREQGVVNLEDYLSLPGAPSYN